MFLKHINLKKKTYEVMRKVINIQIRQKKKKKHEQYLNNLSLEKADLVWVMLTDV